MDGGRLTRRAVNIITIEMMTSVAESMPSPNTARLPANRPITILETDRMALPMVLIQEVLIKISSLDIAMLLNVVFMLFLEVYFDRQNYDKIGG